MTSEDYDDTAAALAIVTEAAEHANETIKQMVSRIFGVMIIFKTVFYAFRKNFSQC